MSAFVFPSGFPWVIKMASGHLSLELSDQVFLDDFPEYAYLFLEVLNGSVEERHDSIVMCIWEVIIHNKKFRIVYDDYPCGVSLESYSDDGDDEIVRLKEFFLSLRSS